MATPPPVLFLLFSSMAQASGVPDSQTFTHINLGEFGPYITEYDASYRTLRMATRRSESLFRWVWEANRGRPVGENATFSLRPDGNLILADTDGTLVWSTSTANKNVAGLNLLPNGNMVLFDTRGRSVWQSFDHPTDTLLVGQSLPTSGPSKLVSRASSNDGGYGIYSLVLGATGLNLGMQINTITLTYSNLSNVFGDIRDSVKLEYELEVGFSYVKLVSKNSDNILARPKYNATLSMLRLQTDGNLVVYTYYDPVDYRAWEKTFALFSDEIGLVSGCGLPSKCGALGVCEDEMCVACPTLKELMGWSEGCQPPKLRGCTAAVDYYKVFGVENFVSANVAGLMVEECRRRCDADCGCKGSCTGSRDPGAGWHH